MSAAHLSLANPDVIITDAGDPRLHCVIPSAGVFWIQDEHGPTYIAVCAAATDEAITQIASRFNVDPLELRQVRDRQIAPGVQP